MTIAIRPLESIEDFRSAVRLQQQILGENTHAIWQLPHLTAIQQSGGLLLGACMPTHLSVDSLDAILIDLLSTVDRYSARCSVAWAVCPQQRNRGMGTELRLIERKALQREDVDLVHWDADPLNSAELYIALNKLGGILTGYSCDTLGSTRDGRAPGLATDRVRVEWWIDSPRVISILDRGNPPPHHDIGLNDMVVLTKTTLLPTGVRGVIEQEQAVTAKHVLAEIPENLDHLQVRDHDAAIQWRLQSRRFMGQLFELGYLGVGLIHEGGRSFLLFKRGTRATELRAASERQQRRL